LLLVLDHCLSSDLREVALGLRTELLLGYFVTHFFFAGRIGLGFFFRAERKHLDALCEKKETKSDTPGKKQVREELSSQKFGAQAKRYLAELHREAMIEYKQ